jgi:hypothetical protein
MTCDQPIGLVYFALALVVLVIVAGAWVVRTAGDAADIETQKVRFAAATFAGILALLVLIVILYYVDEGGRGKEIFEKLLAAVTTLAGGIVGYLFGSKGSGRGAGKVPSDRDKSGDKTKP